MIVYEFNKVNLHACLLTCPKDNNKLNRFMNGTDPSKKINVKTQPYVAKEISYFK